MLNVEKNEEDVRKEPLSLEVVLDCNSITFLCKYFKYIFIHSKKFSNVTRQFISCH